MGGDVDFEVAIVKGQGTRKLHGSTFQLQPRSRGETDVMLNIFYRHSFIVPDSLDALL